MRRVIVGGIPEPIGGVTSFIFRLAVSNRVDRIVDIYPNVNKKELEGYNGDIVYLKGAIGLVKYFIFHYNELKNDIIHFNFSTSKALLLFLALPPLFKNQTLMLHHGELSISPYFKIIFKYVLKRFSIIYSISKSQSDFYLKMGVEKNKIKPVSSYVRPSVVKYVDIPEDVLNYFEDEFILTCSGSTSEFYNHDWCVRFVTKNSQYKLAMFINGSPDEVTKFINKYESFERVKIFSGVGESGFNYAIMKSKVYLRPTSKDSFGVAVADAINFNTKVLCSDVCPRYPGAIIFKTLTYNNFEEQLNNVLNNRNIVYENNHGFRFFEF